MSGHVVLALASGQQEAIWCAVLGAHQVKASSVPPSAHLETELLRAARDSESSLFLIDLAVLAQLAMGAEKFCSWKSAHCPQARLILYCSSMREAPEQARAWARTLGASNLLPGCCVTRRCQACVQCSRKLGWALTNLLPRALFRRCPRRSTMLR